MKFSKIPYVHLEYSEVSKKLANLIENFKNSKNANEAMENYNKVYNYADFIKTMFAISYIRNSMNTTDEYYSKEFTHGYEMQPKFQAMFQDMITATLETPFRKELEEKWGKLIFINEELALKTVSPEVIEDLQEENKLVTEYDKLMASAKIQFDGKELNFSQIAAYGNDLSEDVRKSALVARGNWFKENIQEFDRIFNELTKIRTNIAKKLGYENFVELGYNRMKRNCYDSKMVAEFRKGILEHIVPIVTKFKEAQAKRINSDFPLKLFNSTLKYLDGNAKPIGTEQDLLNHAKKMYEELDPVTGEFFNMLLENELLDVTTRPNKSVGGYCYGLREFKVPFVFANFNGTSADVEVLTHEIGHAFADYMAKDLVPSLLKEYTFDIAEIHSMSMEFLTWNWMNGFFGEQTQKFYESHLSGALGLLPYVSMVDEFQHGIYEKPNMTVDERNSYWAELEKKYMPFQDSSGLPFYGEGRQWQQQIHIYKMPFYYIDYALAQVVALYFWSEAQENHDKAWDKYKKLINYAGTKTFLELIEEVGLPNPFVSDNLKIIADAVSKWLEK